MDYFGPVFVAFKIIVGWLSGGGGGEGAGGSGGGGGGGEFQKGAQLIDR